MVPGGNCDELGGDCWLRSTAHYFIPALPATERRRSGAGVVSECTVG